MRRPWPAPAVRRAVRVVLIGGLLVSCGSPNEIKGGGNTDPPTASISSPANASTYQAGQTVHFAGAGQDGDGNAMPDNQLSWWVEFHHDGITDQFQAPTAGSSGDVDIPRNNSTSTNVFYRFFLRAADGNGADTATRDITPQTVQITVASAGTGRNITVNSASHVAPFVFSSVVGVNHELGAPSPQVVGDSTYTFDSWSDAGDQTHIIIAPATNTTFTATFDAVGPPPNAPPTAVITAPAAAATYHGGSNISFSGTATDFAGAPLTGNSLSWWAELHHDTHTHPFMPVTLGASGSIGIPTSGEVSSNVFYRFYFRAVDAQGVADTVFTDVLPEKVQITVTSNPVGRTLTLDGQPQTGPIVVTGVVGITRSIGAPSPQSSVDSTYTWTSWSDAGAVNHSISTPASNVTYTATFTATGPANQPPTVSITAPLAGANLPVNVALNITATAADADGTVTGVQFFDGATSLGTDNTSPYSVSWTPTVTGPHSLTARATDDDGTSTTSSPAISVNVTGGGPDNQAPTVTALTPADGTTGLTGAPNATANATDNVGVVGVEFQFDGITLGEDLTAPYSIALPTLANFTTGVHQVRARARDAAGNLSAWVVSRVTVGGNVNLPNGFSRTTFVSGLNSTTTAMSFAPDGRLFICEQGGALRVVKNSSLLATPFVTVPTSANGERGLLGVTFHPQFGTAGSNYVYVYYTVTSAGVSHNRISRFPAAINGDVANGPEEIIFDLLPTLGATNHNGGAIHFGPDGKLYVAVGENADPFMSPSNTSFLGKILRLNPDGSIPADNPTLGTGNFKAIWAKGFRNPFTFSFQPGTGMMLINDVGEMTWEEVNPGVAGANYGWPNDEGTTTTAGITNPIFTYRHTSNPTLVVGQAIVGSAFYNPATASFGPEYVGSYFFGDYVQGFINRIDLGTGNTAVYAFTRGLNTVTDLAVGPDGALYVATILAGGSNGVYRFSKP